MADDPTLFMTPEKPKAEQSYKDLGPVGTKDPGAAGSTPTPQHLGRVQSGNDTDSESKADEDDQSSTSPLSNVTSATSQFDTNGKSEGNGTPPRLRLYLQDGDDPVSRKLIEESDADKKIIAESDAELINQSARADDDDFDKDKRAAVHRSAIRGQEDLPLDSIRRKVDDPFEPSEITDITDLGNWLYELKRQNRKRPPSISVNQDDLKEPLQDRLLRALQETPGHAEKKGFFPMDQVDNLVYEECVIEQLRSDLKHQLDDKTIRRYAQKICGSPSAENEEEKPPLFKKIFVILVLSEKTSTILKFLAEEVTDDDLPLLKVPRLDMPATIFDLGRRGKPDVPLECFKTWTSSAIRSFEEWQWTTLAPFFARSERKNVKHYILQDQVILPFLADSRREGDEFDRLEYEGGFGRVFKVDMHPEHHDFHDPHVCNRRFAVKCLLSRDREVFKREVEMLKKFSADSHRHLVSLLATYEQFRRFYLVFHWADADLQDYWEKKNPTPAVDHETILWMAEQCEGIAGGLCKIHHYLTPQKNLAVSEQSMTQLFGRHGDIKPANILWFLDPCDPTSRGTLQITDFGLAEFSAIHRSYKPKSKVATSPSYRPPECDLYGGVIGLSYDIWTMGCLYLEFTTWLLGGWNLVEKFTKNRESFDRELHMPTDTFFEIEKGTAEARIKPAVTDFIFGLHSHELCSDFLHDFLELIRVDMIVVKPKDKGRITSFELHQRLLDMVKRCKCEENYVSQSAPWSGKELERRKVEATPRAGAALERTDVEGHDRPSQKTFVYESRTLVEGCAG